MCFECATLTQSPGSRETRAEPFLLLSGPVLKGALGFHERVLLLSYKRAFPGAFVFCYVLVLIPFLHNCCTVLEQHRNFLIPSLSLPPNNLPPDSAANVLEGFMQKNPMCSTKNNTVGAIKTKANQNKVTKRAMQPGFGE